MCIIENYRSSPALRDAYLRINGINHIEAWPSDHGYVPALCSGPGLGWPERDREFKTIAAAGEWAQRVAPDVPFTGTDDIPVGIEDEEPVAA